MPDHSGLIDTFEQQLSRTARFVASAFHVHTIDSYDWGNGANPGANDRAHFQGEEGQERFLDELVRAGLELVCITDHMRCDYACELAQRAAQREDIAVLPGMEVNCTIPPGHAERIHLLVVFPTGVTPDVIERIFEGQADLPGESARTGQEDVRLPSLAAFRDRVANAGGLLIPAHIDQLQRGHRAHIRSVRHETATMLSLDAEDIATIRDISNEYAEHLVELSPHAVEVTKSEDRDHYARFQTADGARHSVACVARSDHHSVESLADRDAITYVKVSRRDLRPLRDALVFHETRVRFADDLPATPSPRLVGVRLRSPGEGLFADAAIAFNENLNCLIGPRGTGRARSSRRSAMSSGSGRYSRRPRRRRRVNAASRGSRSPRRKRTSRTRRSRSSTIATASAASLSPPTTPSGAPPRAHSRWMASTAASPRGHWNPSSPPASSAGARSRRSAVSRAFSGC